MARFSLKLSKFDILHKKCIFFLDFLNDVREVLRRQGPPPPTPDPLRGDPLQGPPLVDLDPQT